MWRLIKQNERGYRSRSPLTLDQDLPAGAVGAGQQGELLRLVHGVVGAGNHDLVARLPGLLHLVLQVQHHLVHSVDLKARDRKT